MGYTVVITANGHGTRMAKYGVPKHEILFKNRRICDYVRDVFPNALLATHHETEWPIGQRLMMEAPLSRTHTIRQLVKDYGIRKNVLIIDCDIAFDDLKVTPEMCRNCFIYYFESDKEKYGSFSMQDGWLSGAKERGLYKNKTSGIYFIKDLQTLITDMVSLRTDSILEGLTQQWTRCYPESHIWKLGDEQDYKLALKMTSSHRLKKYETPDNSR